MLLQLLASQRDDILELLLQHHLAVANGLQLYLQGLDSLLTAMVRGEFCSGPQNGHMTGASLSSQGSRVSHLWCEAAGHCTALLFP